MPDDNPKLRLDSQFFDPFTLSAILEIRQNPSVQVKILAKKVLKGKTVPYDDAGDVPIIRSGNINQFMSADALLRANTDQDIFYVEKGDVLISSIGFGSIGKVQLFNQDRKFGTVSEVTVVRQAQLEPAYLAAFLSGQYGQLQINRQITGATGQLHLYPDDVGQIYMPKPSPLLEVKIKDCYDKAEAAFAESSKATVLAEIALLEALGLAKWSPPQPLADLPLENRLLKKSMIADGDDNA